MATTLAQRLAKFDPGPDFRIDAVIGQGAYGLVCAATHRVTGERVAIKKISPFDHSLFCLRTLREIKLLKFFDHENIISIRSFVRPRSYDEFNDVYVVQELMESDLHRIIRSQVLSDDHIQYFIYQALRGLLYIHSTNCLHRDLKPSNLLLNSNCDLKLCDFGLARSLEIDDDGNQSFMTEYVATRWYRAPEIMLTFKQYTKAIDVWSIGCIMAEMIGRQPIFPGKDYLHQLHLILNILGTPSPEDFDAIGSSRAREYIRGLPFKERVPFQQIYPHANPLGLDLLEKMLTFNPSRRVTVEECLRHPYLAVYHDPDDEPLAPPLDPQFFDFERYKEVFTKDQLKEMIFREVIN